MSSFDQRVTQWMSPRNVEPASACASSQLHERGLATSPSIVKLHSLVATWGVAPAVTSFGGVSVDVLLDAVGVQDAATHVVAFCHGGYTTNLPLADVCGGRAWIAWEHEGRPLPAEHGGPARLLVPHLYFWKSAKWVRGLRLLDHDESGFWERYGYHDYGDPWKEQRFQGD